MAIIRKGLIVGGEYAGWVVLIDDDRDGDSGGYYLYLKSEGHPGFDSWFELENELQAELSDFNVEWSN